jgi:hypothetical protein
VSSFARVTASDALGVMAAVHAVDVAPVAVAAEVEHPPAAIHTTLNLPQIVHSRGSTAGNSTTVGDLCQKALVERVHSRRPGAWS